MDNAQLLERAIQIAAEAHADPNRERAAAAATDPQRAPAFLAHAMLSFNEQLERIAEVAAVFAVGTLLWAVDWSRASGWRDRRRRRRSGC